MELAPDETVEDDLRNAVWKGSYFGSGVADVMMHVPVDRQFAMRNNNVVIFGAYQRETFALGLDPRQIDPTASMGRLKRGQGVASGWRRWPAIGSASKMGPCPITS